MQSFHTKTLQEIFKITGTNKNGLTSLEAEKRLATFGKNTLQTSKKTNYIAKFLSQFKDIMVIILLCAAVISLIFAVIQKSTSELIDAIIIFVIVLINAILGFSQEIKANKALESLKNMSQPYSTILRNGHKLKVKTSDIVVGDIVLLEAGDIVPADLYLIESFNLKCDESSLTGESTNASKQTNLSLPEGTPLGDRKNMCFSSSTITYGRGQGVVVATGKDAEIGKIATMLDDHKEEITPLQSGLNKLGEIITFIVIAIAIIIFVVDILFTKLGYIESFLTAVAIAVAAIPESLPAVVTIILSLGVMKLAKKNVIVKKLHAVETLGCCEVICSDKTGTITENRMSIEQVCFDLELFSHNKKINSNSQTFKDLMLCMVLNNNSSKEDNGYMGDPTETALLRFCETLNYNKTEMESRFPRVAEIPFDSNRKLMTTVNKIDGKYVQYTKGALDRLIDKCTYIQVGDIVRPLTEEDKMKIKTQNKKMCDDALRVLSYAKKEITAPDFASESGLIFLGLSGIIDPPRKEVFDAIQKCKKAKMRVIMITGDHKDTATAIAKRLGIIKTDKEVLNGTALDKLTDSQLANEIVNYSVFSRVSPEHKVRIVRALKSRGKIVAMTGDGVNDAPSIKIADIGIGMGKNGTEVTKEVSKMILTDDNFATIVVAVEEGRRIFGNIQKTVQFLLSCNIAEVIAIFLLTILFPKYAFLSAVQILFINLITDTLPSIALGLDRAEKNIMSSPPRSKNENIVSKKIWFNILYQGVAQAIIVILSYLVGINGFNSPKVASTMAFLTLNFIQLFHMYNVHSNQSIFIDSAFKNKFVNYSFLCEIGLFVIISLFPAVSNILNMTPLNITQWLIVFALSFLIIPVCEITKFLQRKREK